jgi:hypothetical protein
VVANSDAREYKNGPVVYDVYASQRERRLTNGRTQSRTHKNNTATDKEADPNRKRYFAIVQKDNVSVGRRRHLTKIYCKSKKNTNKSNIE